MLDGISRLDLVISHRMAMTLSDNDLSEPDLGRAGRISGNGLRIGLAGVALAATLLFAACGGGDDDDDTSSEPGGATDAATAPSSATTSPSTSSPTAEAEESEEADESEGVRAPLEVGSSLEIDAPDSGQVKVTILEIRSPANDLLNPALTVDPGQELWAVKLRVEVDGGEDNAISDFTVTTTDANTYGFTGTASDNDIGYSFEQGTTDEGFVAFQIPEGEEVETLTLLFSIYVGYDMIFES